MEPKLQELKDRLLEIGDLRSTEALLTWDQMTFMPPGGAEARARRIATLDRLGHEKLIDEDLGRLLEDLQPLEASLPYEADEAALIRLARRDYERAIKVPTEFVSRMSAHLAETYAAWTRARPADDFAAILPFLQKTLEFSREYAGYFPDREHIADPLIDLSDYGMKASSIRKLFATLRVRLVPIVEAATTRPPADDTCLRRDYPEDAQLAFGLAVIKRFGFDFERGRQDRSPHPFTIGLSLNDVRITTRVRRDDLGEALFSTMHEAGHAMYEQDIDQTYEGTPLAGGTSSGVHESQSRLWENVVGRSLAFWRYFYPELQAAFPAQLGAVPLDPFYRAINKVERSLIRTEADEVTYNLHVMLRFDLELAMLEGKLAVRDLPEAWRERFRADFGLLPPDDKDGVLQDIHWYGGPIGGAFQGYTLGNIMSAQFFRAALEAHQEIPGEIERGEFGTLHGWLRENVYRHGSKFTATELIERACGTPLSIEPYLEYLQAKYGKLCGI